MCRVIAVSNQKGGVGKTTTSINLGVGLARMGQRVLLVDSDPQGHLTLGLGFPKNIRVTLKNMMENIIMGIEFDPKEAVLHHKEGVDVVPSNKLLTGMDMSLITVDDREKVLKEYLEMMTDDYHYRLYAIFGYADNQCHECCQQYTDTSSAPVLCCGWPDGTAESGKRNKKTF